MAYASCSRRSRACYSALVTASIFSLAAFATNLLYAPAARADDSAIGGDSRTLAMGGAGIALPPDLNGGEGRVNPASLAFEKGNIGLNGPGFGFRANNVDVNKTSSYFITGISASSAAALSRQFASHDSDFGVNGDVGIRFGHLEIAGGGVAIGRIQPNAALTNWVQAGSNLDSVPAEVRSDLYGAAIYNMPSVSYAMKIPQPRTSSYQVAMGARLKYMEGVYSHYISNVDTVRGLFNANPASEMNGQSTLTQQGIGMDFGVMARPTGRNPLSMALVATNVVNPNFSFVGTDRNGRPTRYNLVASTISAGLGYQKRGTTLAADLADIGAATGSAQLRMGVEQKVLKIVALRAGYCSATGYTAGIGIRGFSFAYGKRMPLEIARTLSF